MSECNECKELGIIMDALSTVKEWIDSETSTKETTSSSTTTSGHGPME